MYFYNERYRVERMKTIHVSNETWRSLQELKLGKGYNGWSKKATELAMGTNCRMFIHNDVLM